MDGTETWVARTLAGEPFSVDQRATILCAAAHGGQVGAEVTELIQGFVIAMQLEATEEDLMRTVFPHPTLSEMMGESFHSPKTPSRCCRGCCRQSSS